jgi:hypothetical protein
LLSIAEIRGNFASFARLIAERRSALSPRAAWFPDRAKSGNMSRAERTRGCREPRCALHALRGCSYEACVNHRGG